MPGPNTFSRRREHPYQAKNLTDLPVELRQLAERSLGLDGQVDLIFVVPPQVFPGSSWGGPRYVPEQALLFTPLGVLHVQSTAAPRQAGQATYLHGAELVYARLSLLLLYGRLELAGLVNGVLSRVIVEYNTVGHDLLQPGLLRFLRLAWGPAQAQENDNDTETLLCRLGGRSFKFMNGLRYYALQPDEHLLGYVFQPRIVRRYWRVFHRQIAPMTLLALTENTLIVIEEEQIGRAPLGWHFTFCPRICVSGIEAKPNKEWQDLYVHLVRGPVGADRRMTLDNETTLAWRALWLNQGVGTREKENVSTAIHP